MYTELLLSISVYYKLPCMCINLYQLNLHTARADLGTRLVLNLHGHESLFPREIIYDSKYRFCKVCPALYMSEHVQFIPLQVEQMR